MQDTSSELVLTDEERDLIEQHRKTTAPRLQRIAAAVYAELSSDELFRNPRGQHWLYGAIEAFGIDDGPREIYVRFHPKTGRLHEPLWWSADTSDETMVADIVAALRSITPDDEAAAPDYWTREGPSFDLRTLLMLALSQVAKDAKSAAEQDVQKEAAQS